MAGVVLIAREGGRAGHAAAALGLAAWLMLLADPATVADAGFLLSVAATAGLLAWATPLTSWIGAHVPEPDADVDRRGARRLPFGAGSDAAHRPPRLRATLPRGPDRQPGGGALRPAGDDRRRPGRAGRLARRGRCARSDRHPGRPGGPRDVRRPHRDRPTSRRPCRWRRSRWSRRSPSRRRPSSTVGIGLVVNRRRWLPTRARRVRLRWRSPPVRGPTAPAPVSARWPRCGPADAGS